MKICPHCLERSDEDLNFCPEDGTELRDIHAREESEDPLVGRVLEDKWVVEERIGSGGMGTVYRGTQRNVDRTVAIKVLRPNLAEDETHVERFFREANVAANISDPRCVTIHDFGQTRDDHLLYLAMEYLEGRSLHAHLGEQALSLGEILEIGIQIARALETLHGAKVVHRDLKPENVFLIGAIGEGIFLKLLDFGLAKLLDARATPITRTGEVFGTPEFMSPEQCQGGDIDARSDLYSLGCILYELVSGRPPFDQDNSVSIVLAHINEHPPKLSGRAAVPEPLEACLARMLAKHPDDRFQTATEAREALEQLREELEWTDEHAYGPAVSGDESETDARASTTEDGGLVPVENPAPPDADTIATDVPDEGADESAPVASAPAPEGNGDERAEELERPSFRGWPLGVLVGLLAVAAVYGVPLWTGDSSPREAESRSASPSTVRDAGAGLDAAGAEPDVAADTDGGAEADGHTARSDTGLDTTGDAKARSTDSGRADEEESTSPATASPSEPSPRAGEAAADERDEREPSDSSSGSAEETEGGSPFPVLTKSSAAQILRDRTSQVEACFERALGEHPQLEGRVRLRLIVSSDGEVKSASIAESTVPTRAIETCVLEKARSWSFPPTFGDHAMELFHDYAFQWRPAGSPDGGRGERKTR